MEERGPRLEEVGVCACEDERAEPSADVGNGPAFRISIAQPKESAMQSAIAFATSASLILPSVNRATPSRS